MKVQSKVKIQVTNMELVDILRELGVNIPNNVLESTLNIKVSPYYNTPLGEDQAGDGFDFTIDAEEFTVSTSSLDTKVSMYVPNILILDNKIITKYTDPEITTAIGCILEAGTNMKIKCIKEVRDIFRHNIDLKSGKLLVEELIENFPVFQAEFEKNRYIGCGGCKFLYPVGIRQCGNCGKETPPNHIDTIPYVGPETN